MSKILNADFRKEVYKNLLDAGYDKNEAQVIVGKKYYGALKEDVLSKINDIMSIIQADNLEQPIQFNDISAGISELSNLKKILQPKAE